jgi:glucose/arabinose dehydrogenase
VKPGWVVAVAVVLGACGSDSPATRDSASPTTTAAPVTAAPDTAPAPAPSTTRPAPTTTTRATDDCAVALQRPPSRTLAASFPTALGFAPDGRLFFTERSGTIKVVQDGATKVFGTVATVTTGERGLLGLAISPTFATDRLVYTFHSARSGTTQEVVPHPPERARDGRWGSGGPDRGVECKQGEHLVLSSPSSP